MPRKLSLALFLLAAIFLFLVVMTGRNTSWDKKITTGEYYFPGLKDEINDVSLIKISQSGNTFEIVRLDNEWILKNKDNFPADTNKVKTNLIAASNAIKIEPKTQRQHLFTKLDLEDPSLPNAKSYLMELYNDNNKILASVIVGKRIPNLIKRGEFGVYLRNPSSMETWLVSGNLNASDGVKNWISTRLFDLVPDNILRLHVSRGDRTPLKFGRDPIDNNKFRMVDFLSGIETRTSIGLRSVMRQFLKVEFRDMREGDTYNLRPDADIEIETIDNYTINLEVYNEPIGQGAWVFVSKTDHPDQIKNIGYEFYLDQNSKDEFIIKLEHVLKVD
tara:strand:+ start:2324 stop:3319 length:996 start_codon:yes stop_codon:yes gene_type:complete